jgi:aminoglycoside/choline kinase family phosphotransferase
MDVSDKAIDEFLSKAGWGSANRTHLAGDASNRRYERIVGEDQTSVLMIAPPSKGEDIRPFITIAKHLSETGLNAPDLFAAESDQGLLLMEDFGDTLFARHCTTNPEDELRLYRSAVDVLLHLHSRTAPAHLPPYNAAEYLREVQLFTDWYLKALGGVSPAAQSEYDDIFNGLFAELTLSRPVTVLRDYHAENLVWLPDRAGLQAVGLLDFQDALAGHPAYDLVSLLEDARRDTAPSMQQDMIQYYLDHSDQNPQDFRTAYAILGAQRNLKIIGIFTRLAHRDGKPAYIDLIPRVAAHLNQDLHHPRLADLKGWMEQNAPVLEQDVLDRLKEGPA